MVSYVPEYFGMAVKPALAVKGSTTVPPIIPVWKVVLSYAEDTPLRRGLAGKSAPVRRRSSE